jgi:hypothetical protein
MDVLLFSVFSYDMKLDETFYVGDHSDVVLALHIASFLLMLSLRDAAAAVRNLTFCALAFAVAVSVVVPGAFAFL